MQCIGAEALWGVLVSTDMKHLYLAFGGHQYLLPPTELGIQLHGFLSAPGRGAPGGGGDTGGPFDGEVSTAPKDEPEWMQYTGSFIHSWLH